MIKFQLFKFAGDFTLALLLSILASLALESPIVIIEKVIFGGRKRTTEQPKSANDLDERVEQPVSAPDDLENVLPRTS